MGLAAQTLIDLQSCHTYTIKHACTVATRSYAVFQSFAQSASTLFMVHNNNIIIMTTVPQQSKYLYAGL